MAATPRRRVRPAPGLPRGRGGARLSPGMTGWSDGVTAMGKGLTGRLLRQWESPPTWLALFLGLAWVQSRVLPLFDAGPVGRIAGAVLIAAGLGVMLLAATQFLRHRTTVLPR